MLQNAYFLAKIGADTAENEQHFAEMFDPREQVPRSDFAGHLALRPELPRELRVPAAEVPDPRAAAPARVLQGTQPRRSVRVCATDLAQLERSVICY